jgi:hypothetical protein
LIVAYQDTNSKTLFVAKASNNDASDLTGGVNTGISIRYTPAVAVWNNRLYVAFNSRSDSQWWITSSSDATTFTSPVHIALSGGVTGIRTDWGIGLASLNGLLYFSFVADGTNSSGGSSPNAYIAQSTDGVNFTNITCKACSMTVNYGASLTTSGSSLILTTTDADGNLFSFGGLPSNGARYKYTPQGVQWNSYFYVFGRNWADAHYILETATAGAGTWTSYNRYSQQMDGACALTVFRGRLFLATRTNGAKKLMLFYADN